MNDDRVSVHVRLPCFLSETFSGYMIALYDLRAVTRVTSSLSRIDLGYCCSVEESHILFAAALFFGGYAYRDS